MDLRQEQVSIDADRYRYRGRLTLPSEGPVCGIAVSAEGVGEQPRVVGAALVVQVAHASQQATTLEPAGARRRGRAGGG